MRMYMKRQGGTTRQQSVVKEEEEEEDDDLFGSNEEDEDFDLFGSSNESKSESISKSKSTWMNSEVKLHNDGHGGAGRGGFPLLFPGGGGSVPKSLPIGLFGNSGMQNMSGLVNMTGVTRGGFNGSLILGDNNSFTVYIN